MTRRGADVPSSLPPGAPEPDPLERKLLDLGRSLERAREDPCPRQIEAVAFVAGTLPPDRVSAVEAELATCPSCRRAAVDYARAMGVETEVVREAAARRPPAAVVRTWAVAAAFAIAAVGIGFVVLSTRSDRRRAQAIERLLASAAGGAEPRSEDLALFEEALPDSGARRRLLASPRSIDAWLALDRLLGDRSRGGAEDDAPTPERLLAPRATVSDATPEFVFEVPEPSGREWRYRLEIRGPEGAAKTIAVVQEGTNPGPLRFALPAAEPLAPDQDYEWSVRLDAESHPDYAAFYRPEPATFRVVEIAERERLRRIRETGEPGLDALMRAAALVGGGLAADALRELESPPAGAGRADLEPIERLVRAEALALLGRRAEYAALRADAGAHGSDPAEEPR